MKQAALLFLCACCVAAKPLRVQVTTGGHPYDLSFYRIFEDQNDLKVTLNPHPSAFRRPLPKFADVLVLYDLNDISTDKEKDNLRGFLEGGGGLVVLHHALADNWQWQWWYEEVVGGRFLMAPEGDRPRSRAKTPATLVCKPVAQHPVLEGVPALKLDDESYGGMQLSPKAQVLMETDHPENDKAVVWIGPWQKSRVVAIQLGHGPGAHNDPGYRRLVQNAILWAGKRR